MSFILNYLFITFPEFFTIFLWGTTLFGYRFSEIKKQILFMAAFSGLFSDLLWKINILSDFRILITLTSSFLLYKFILKNSWIRSFFIFFSTFFSLLITESIIVIVVGQFINIDDILQSFPLKFLITFLYLSPLMLGTWILHKKNKSILSFFNQNGYDRKKALYWTMIFVFAFLQGYLIIYMNYAFYIEEYQFLHKEIIFKISGFPIVSLILIIANIVLIYFTIKLKNYHLEKEIIQYEDSYHENIQNLIHTLKSERHDYLNEIQTLYILAKTESFDELKQYIQQLVNNIQSLNRVTQIKNIPVSALLHSKWNEIESKGVALEVITKTSDIFPTIKGYDLVKIISNILDNALRAVTEFPVKNPKIEFIWDKQGNEAVISIANNGPKIEKELLSKIFQQGFSTKKANGQHGYGLSIVKKIIEKYHGSIEVLSDDHKTEFIMKIPL
ncbi:sensor histidine kinase [Tepidibacillus fermentans]|uniref:histidine kinase n=1 Tax=Tepidibacillus fermentans TaxID=1281767 RepID=A0A4R3KK80_9BACI|nr:ATP-binding protein [Tepidibacillus fermentans]TCS83795.1 sensor kinase SpoOB-type protein [Tepidibacillus fermentans]